MLCNKNENENYYLEDHPQQEFLFSLHLGVGHTSKEFFFKKGHPSFHSGFLFVKFVLSCSVLPALADNIKSAIIIIIIIVQTLISDLKVSNQNKAYTVPYKSCLASNIHQPIVKDSTGTIRAADST